MRLPLVLVSHGGLRSASDTGAWLSSALARAGFLAVEVNGPRPTDPGDAVNEIWRRPEDLSEALDVLAEDPVWSGRIDTDRIYAVGFALGGTAVVSLIGGKLDATAYEGACDGSVRGPDCAWFKRANVSLAAVAESELVRTHRDPRVRVAVAINPEYREVFSPESLANAEAPVLIVALDDPGSSMAPADPIGPSRVRIPEASASDGFPTCTPAGPAILADEGGDPDLCGTNAEKREMVHAQIADQITSFLKEVARN